MNKIEKNINNYLSHYNGEKYWKYKFKLHNAKIPKLIRYIYLFTLKKMEAYNNASLGNRVNGGSMFKEKPNLPHGIKGIFITDCAKIGEGCTIFQQVTIGLKNCDDTEGPILGNNVVIGTGAKIIGKVKIGNNVKIGANAIVVEDIPDNATVVMKKPRIIIKGEKNEKNKNII